MCQQLEVLEKIRKAGEMNGFAIDLAEAQAKDYIRMNKKVGNIEKDISSIKKEQKKQGEMLARQGGQIDLIVQRMNSPVDEERKNGMIYAELKSIIKTPMGKTLIILAIGCLCMVGPRIIELLETIKGWF